MFERRSGSNVSELSLHHSAQVSGRVVSELYNLARLTFENNHHTASDLGSRNSHKTEFSVEKCVYLIGVTLYSEVRAAPAKGVV